MRIGLFTDTYFPQVSGVATSICTLKEELEKAWDDLSADDPEGCPEGEENADDPADQDIGEDGIPTIHVNSDDTDKA